MLSNTQNSIIINKGKDLKNQKAGLIGMANKWILIQVNNIYRSIVGQFDIGQLGYGTSLVQHFGSSKYSDKQDVEPAT